MLLFNYIVLVLIRYRITIQLVKIIINLILRLAVHRHHHQYRLGHRPFLMIIKTMTSTTAITVYHTRRKIETIDIFLSRDCHNKGPVVQSRVLRVAQVLPVILLQYIIEICRTSKYVIWLNINLRINEMSYKN